MSQLVTSKPEMQFVNTNNKIGDREYLMSVADLTRKRKTGVFSYRWWKAILDCIFAVLVVVLTLPLMAMIAIYIRIDSPGCALYRREQVGENGRKFTAYKFRTMYVDNSDYEYKKYLMKYILEDAPYQRDEDDQPVYKVVDDPRVTKFGDLLRKTNLDELPQFFNVLKGEMSLVGPRPDIPFAVAMYADKHNKRLEAKPGITGLWQVCGRKHLSFKDMVNIDIDYIKKQSFFFDLKIVLLTIRTILKMDGS